MPSSGTINTSPRLALTLVCGVQDKACHGVHDRMGGGLEACLSLWRRQWQ